MEHQRIWLPKFFGSHLKLRHTPGLDQSAGLIVLNPLKLSVQFWACDFTAPKVGSGCAMSETSIVTTFASLGRSGCTGCDASTGSNSTSVSPGGDGCARRRFRYIRP